MCQALIWKKDGFSHEEKCDMLEYYLVCRKCFLKGSIKKLEIIIVFLSKHEKKELYYNRGTRSCTYLIFRGPEDFKNEQIDSLWVPSSSSSFSQWEEVFSSIGISTFVTKYVNVNNFHYILWSGESQNSNSGMYNRKTHNYWSKENLLLENPRDSHPFQF